MGKAPDLGLGTAPPPVRLDSGTVARPKGDQQPPAPEADAPPAEEEAVEVEQAKAPAKRTRTRKAQPAQGGAAAPAPKAGARQGTQRRPRAAQPPAEAVQPAPVAAVEPSPPRRRAEPGAPINARQLPARHYAAGQYLALGWKKARALSAKRWDELEELFAVWREEGITEDVIAQFCRELGVPLEEPLDEVDDGQEDEHEGATAP